MVTLEVSIQGQFSLLLWGLVKAMPVAEEPAYLTLPGRQEEGAWAGEMTQSGKRCRHQREDLSLISRKLGMVVHTWNPSAGETEAGEFLELTGQAA